MQTPSEIASTGIAIIPNISARGSDATHSVKGTGRGSSGVAAMGRSPIRSPPTLGFAGLIRSVRGRVRRDSKRLTTKGDARLRRLTAPPSNPKAPAVCRMPHRRDRPACRNFAGRSPRLTFQVVGQSRDDVLTVVQAGGHHPGSQRRPTFIIRKPHQAFCDCWSRISCFLQTCALPARRFPPPWSVEEQSACFVVRGGAFRPRLVQILNDEQDYDDRAENDHPIGNLNTCYRCFLLEPFHCLPPRIGRLFRR